MTLFVPLWIVHNLQISCILVMGRFCGVSVSALGKVGPDWSQTVTCILQPICDLLELQRNFVLWTLYIMSFLVKKCMPFCTTLSTGHWKLYRKGLVQVGCSL